MNAMNYDRKILKGRAKASLRGIQPRPWKVTLVYLLIASIVPMAVSCIVQMLNSGGTVAKLIEIGSMQGLEYMDVEELLPLYLDIYRGMATTGVLSLFVSILLSLVQVVMNYGYQGYSLKLYRGEQTAVRDVFSGLYVAGRAICTSIMTAIFTFLWTLLAVVLAVCAVLIVMVASFAVSSQGPGFLAILMLLLIYLGIIVFAVCIGYRYSLAPYFILTTDMGTMDAIRESKNAMRGNIGRRFMLDLSFVGWVLLEALIMMVVVYGGIFISIFTIGFNLAMSGAAVEYMDAAALSALMTQFMGGMYVSMAVAVLAALPLSLWLTPYMSSAQAGFFLAVTGQDDAPRTAQPVTDYIPPQPSDIWDNVPPPPSFTTSEPPVTEQEPTVEAPVVEPQAVTEAPVEPVTEAPAEPEPPVVEASAEPESPVVEAPVEGTGLTDEDAKGEA